MKKLLYLALVLVVFISCDKDDDTEDERPANEVWMSASSFIPASLTVKAGTTVKWVNTSTEPHNVVSNTGEFTSEILGKDHDFSYTFEELGNFNYVCELHPAMTGTIIVEE